MSQSLPFPKKGKNTIRVKKHVVYFKKVRDSEPLFKKEFWLWGKWIMNKENKTKQYTSQMMLMKRNEKFLEEFNQLK